MIRIEDFSQDLYQFLYNKVRHMLKMNLILNDLNYISYTLYMYNLCKNISKTNKEHALYYNLKIFIAFYDEQIITTLHCL